MRELIADKADKKFRMSRMVDGTAADTPRSEAPTDRNAAPAARARVEPPWQGPGAKIGVWGSKITEKASN